MSSQSLTKTRSAILMHSTLISRWADKKLFPMRTTPNHDPYRLVDLGSGIDPEACWTRHGLPDAIRGRIGQSSIQVYGLETQRIIDERGGLVQFDADDVSFEEHISKTYTPSYKLDGVLWRSPNPKDLLSPARTLIDQGRKLVMTHLRIGGDLFLETEILNPECFDQNAEEPRQLKGFLNSLPIVSTDYRFSTGGSIGPELRVCVHFVRTQ